MIGASFFKTNKIENQLCSVIILNMPEKIIEGR